MNPNSSGRDIDSVVAAHQAELLALPGVTGVGIGIAKGKEVIVVFVAWMAHEDGCPSQHDVPSNRWHLRGCRTA